MGKNKNFILNLNTFLTGSGRGRPLGNLRVDLPDVTLKYGLRTTSRSEDIDLTVNHFLGAKWGNSPPLSLPLILTDQMAKVRVALLHTWRVRVFKFTQLRSNADRLLDAPLILFSLFSGGTSWRC